MYRKVDTMSIFFDYSAAFDCVRIPLLLWKLEKQFFIHGNFLQIIGSLFADRFSAVIIGGVIGCWRKDIIGVP